MRLLASVALVVLTRLTGAQPPAAATADTTSPPPAVTPQRLERPAPGEWLQVGRDYANQRFSPLAQITPATVARLAPRALFQLAPALGEGGAEAAPVVADGRLYVTTDYDVVSAFELRTRTRLWRYAPKLGVAKPCCGPVNRGVALAHGMVFLGTLDSRLIALDALTGAVRWEAVNNDPDSAYSITMAPAVVGERVIVGTSGGEFATRGSVTAYDAATGRRLWRWYAIPSPEEGGWWGRWSPNAPTGEPLGRDVAAERADSARYADTWRTGGGPVWAQPAYDPAAGLLYVTVGNPAPSNDGRARPGDNLYTASVVALDVATGKLRWYFQAIPHDVWDSDLATPPMIVRDGGRPLLLVAGKTGWLYVLDATTGALVRRSDAFVPQQNLFAVPTADGVVTAPGPAGGANWPPSAYSPPTGLYYVLGNHFPFRVTRAESEARKGEVWLGGEYKPAGQPYGLISAIRPSTGKIVWQQRTAMPWSGVLATAGGLVFAGDVDGWFRAWDAGTGKPLWAFYCGAGVNAPPVSFELDGQQYVAVVAAGSRYSEQHGSALLVFGIGGAPVDAPRAVVERTETAPVHATPVANVRDEEALPSTARRVGPYLAYEPAERVAWVRLDAGGPAGPMTFNGATGGAQTYVVPRGWRVEVRFRNDDAAPHSARVVGDAHPISLTAAPASFAGAETASALSGIPSGRRDRFTFMADRAGSYLVACAVPGHAAGGMFVRLVVSDEATVPTVR